jgi:protein LTV1
MVIETAVDEFIEDKKTWFRDLHKHYGEDEGDGTILAPKNSEAIRQVDIGDEEDREEVEAAIREKILYNQEKFSKDAEGKNPFGDSDGEEEEAKWDCESILSTYTNTDNHPGVIKTTRRVKPKATIQLHKQFRVPLDGLTPIAEEIEVLKEAKKKVESMTAYVELSESDDDEVVEETGEGDANDKEDRKAAKKA